MTAESYKKYAMLADISGDRVYCKRTGVYRKSIKKKNKSSILHLYKFDGLW